MTNDGFSQLHIERSGGITRLTLNRPEFGNAIDDLMHSELTRVFSRLDADPETSVVVLTGAGDKFCVGGDLSPTRQFVSHSHYQPVQEARMIFESAIAMSKPMIAAINGDALGFGAMLATLADVSFVDPSATIADMHVNGGLVAGNGPLTLWPLLVGTSHAKRLLMGGERIDATEAVAIGLLTKLSDAVSSLSDAEALAQKWAALPQQAVQQTKRVINQHINAAAASTFMMGLAYEQQVMESPEFQELLTRRRASA